jgi:hypothetical protein
MPSEALRRKAGARGAGDGQPTELENPAAAKKKPEKTPEEVRKILRPDVLEFAITRQTSVDGVVAALPFKLVVPMVFTLGDILQRDVEADFEAYIQLIMTEVAEITGKSDLRINPMRMFLQENLPFIDIAVATSNVRRFLDRILLKAAYVVDPGDRDQTKRIALPTDLVQLKRNDIVAIGAQFVGRWFDRWLEARKAEREAAGAPKNAAGAAQT